MKRLSLIVVIAGACLGQTANQYIYAGQAGDPAGFWAQISNNLKLTKPATGASTGQFDVSVPSIPANLEARLSSLETAIAAATTANQQLQTALADLIKRLQAVESALPKPPTASLRPGIDKCFLEAFLYPLLFGPREAVDVEGNKKQFAECRAKVLTAGL